MRSRRGVCGAAFVVAAGAMSFAAPAVHAAMIINLSTTQHGGMLFVNPADELIVHGPSNPQLRLTGGATSKGVEGVVLGTDVGNGRLLVDGASTLTNGGDGVSGSYGGVPIDRGSGYLGLIASSTGSATVTGSGSRWTNARELYVGAFGAGLLHVEEGGEVTNTIGYIGAGAGSAGLATVTGTGSKWTSTEELYVGYFGAGTLDVLNGGAVDSADGAIGFAAGSNGTATIAGAGSTWNNAGALYAGIYGAGTLTIRDGGTVINTRGYLGYQAGSSGEATVTGDGSTWNTSGELYVGYAGAGALNVEDSGEVTSGDSYLGYESGSTGTATVIGSGSNLTHARNLYVGYSGAGALSVRDGGEVVTHHAFLGDQTGSTGTATVTGSGSKWTLLYLSIGNRGTGTLLVERGGEIVATSGSIGFHRNSVGTATVTGQGSKWTNSSSLFVGDFSTGVLNVKNGGVVTSAHGYLGAGYSTTGTATITGAGSMWVNSDRLHVGNFGAGTLNVENGGQVTSVTGYLGVHEGAIGWGPDSTGTVTVTGSGSKWTNSGNLYVGQGGVGTLNIQLGGAVEVAGGTFVGNDNSVIRLTPGGTFRTGSLDTGGVASRFNWTGGTLIITGDSSDIPDVPATGTLGGTGTITSDVTVHGTLAPGASVGTLSFENTTLTLSDGMALAYEFDTTGSDLVRGVGNSDKLHILGSGVINLTGTGLPRSLLLFTGFETIKGLDRLQTWSIYLNDERIDAGFEADFDAGSITVTLVPEPTALSLLSIVGVTLLRRRSR